jgi:hypothetical protein
MMNYDVTIFILMWSDNFLHPDVLKTIFDLTIKFQMVMVGSIGLEPMALSV